MDQDALRKDTCFDPATLTVLTEAFDQAWARIASRYHDPTVIQAKRDRLARVILNLAGFGMLKREVLVEAAVAAIDLSEPGQLKR